jgi:hypothetical protein
MVFVVLKCAKSPWCAKNHQKEMLSLCFKAGHPFSMKQHHPCHFQAHRRREQWGCSLQSPPSCHPNKNDDRQTNTQNKEPPTHSKLKFQIQIAENAHEVVSGAKKIAPQSVYVDSDAVRLYRAGKASCWHAGVMLAAPTVKTRRIFETIKSKFKIWMLKWFRMMMDNG